MAAVRAVWSVKCSHSKYVDILSVNLPRASWYVEDSIILGDGVFHPVLHCTQYPLFDLEVFGL